jgi:hypothetical protein
MSWRSTVTSLVVVGGLGFAAGTVFSEDTDGKKPNKEEMEKAMEEAARPAPQHSQLRARAGTWDADVSMWMEPGGEAQKSRGTITSRPILNGLWLAEDFRGEFEGKTFEGHSMLGYSKERQKHFGLWVSSMNSTPEIVWGTADASGKTITFDGEPVPCPMGTYVPRWIVRQETPDRLVFEHWAKFEGTDDYVKGLEIRSTRRAGTGPGSGSGEGMGEGDGSGGVRKK